MLKTVAIIVILTSLIFLTACGGEAKPKKESNSGGNTPTQSSVNNTKQLQNNDSIQSDEASFKAELSIDLKSYQDQLPESDIPALEVLKKNLTALVEHNHTLFQSGFVNEKLALAMEYYYGEQLQYRFTDIESIVQNVMIENQVHITVVGRRLDTTTDQVQDVKMLYAIRSNDQGEWFINTID